MFNRRIGAILQEARKSRKLTIRDVAEETNISARYIEALENEDFNQFPGETYALGFLNNYADYLNLEKEELLDIFRGNQIDLNESPIKELTQPVSSFFRFFPFLLGRRFYFLLLLLLIVGAVVFFGLMDFRLLQHSMSVSETVAYCTGDREVQVITLPVVGSPPRSETLSLNPPNSLRFSVDDLYIKFCLSAIEKKFANGPLQASFQMRINDRHNYSFSVQEKETHILDGRVEALAGLQRRIKIRPVVVGDFSARIEIEAVASLTAEELPQKAAVVSSSADIQVTLEFIQDSYLEWVQDGKLYRGRTIRSGEVRTLEAKNRLEIKIGNGGGVRIHREKVKPQIAGPVAKIVRLEYRRIPNRLDPSIFQIKQSIEVIR